MAASENKFKASFFVRKTSGTLLVAGSKICPPCCLWAYGGVWLHDAPGSGCCCNRSLIVTVCISLRIYTYTSDVAELVGDLMRTDPRGRCIQARPAATFLPADVAARCARRVSPEDLRDGLVKCRVVVGKAAIPELVINYTEYVG